MKRTILAVAATAMLSARRSLLQNALVIHAAARLAPVGSVKRHGCRNQREMGISLWEVADLSLGK